MPHPILTVQCLWKGSLSYFCKFNNLKPLILYARVSRQMKIFVGIERSYGFLVVIEYPDIGLLVILLKIDLDVFCLNT